MHATLAAHLVLALDPAAELPSSPDRPSRLARCRDLLIYRVNELIAAEAARTRAEDEYLDGKPAVFPSLRQAWAEQLQSIWPPQTRSRRPDQSRPARANRWLAPRSRGRILASSFVSAWVPRGLSGAG